MRKQFWLMMALLALALLLVGTPPAQAQEDGGRLCVTAFNDDNRNGVRDPIEPLMADVAVYLQSDQGVVVASYVTDGRSEPYCFTGLNPATYIVEFNAYDATPTVDPRFTVAVPAGATLPVQVQFGATPADSVPETVAAAPAPAAADNGLTTLRLVFALGGAGLVMVLFVGLGVVIYWLRYR